MLVHRLPTAALALLFAGLWSATGQAQTRKPAPPANAEELQSRGFKALKAKAYQEALSDFEQAYQQNYHALLLGMIARAQLELGQCDASIQSARGFTAAASVADLESAKHLLGHVLEECPALGIDSDPAGARLFIDGSAAEPPRTPWSGHLKAGEHRVRVRADDGRQREQTVSLRAGEEHPIALHLKLPEPKLAAATPAQTTPAPSMPSPPLVVATAPRTNPKPAATETPVAAPAEAVEAQAPRRSRSWAPPLASDLLFGAAGAAAVVAIAQGIEADRCAGQVTNPVQLQAASDCQSTHAKVANFAWLGAGLAATAGGVLWVVHATGDAEHPGVAAAGRF